MPDLPDLGRSHRWFGVNILRPFGHRSGLLQMGYELSDVMGKPAICIFSVWSGIDPLMPAHRPGMPNSSHRWPTRSIPAAARRFFASTWRQTVLS